MKANELLQVVFAFFLGLVVVAFVGIGVNTFYPEPDYPTQVALQDTWDATYSSWSLVTMIILLICATALLALSLLLPADQGVISNGILLGGSFTMLYAVGVSLSSSISIARFLVVAGALAVTVIVGYLRFVRGRSRAHPGASQETTAGLLAAGYSESPDVERRLNRLETKFYALTKALSD